MKLRMLIGLAVLLALSANVMADYVIVDVVNGSFELPGTTKMNAWDGETTGKGDFDDVPGWSTDTVATDSGVESDWPGSTDGVWSGFMRGNDPAIWQLLGHQIDLLDDFYLKVDARDNWTTDAAKPAQLEIMLYAQEVGGLRTPLATAMGSMKDNSVAGEEWGTFSVEFSALNDPTAIGKKIGVSIYNASGTGDSWIGIDNVRFVPEPATIALLGLGGLSLLRRKRS